MSFNIIFHQVFHKVSFKTKIPLEHANHLPHPFSPPPSPRDRKESSLNFHQASSRGNTNKTHFDDSSEKLNSFGAFDTHRLFEYVEKACLFNLRCLNRSEPTRRPFYYSKRHQMRCEKEQLAADVGFKILLSHEFKSELFTITSLITTSISPSNVHQY